MSWVQWYSFERTEIMLFRFWMRESESHRTLTLTRDVFYDWTPVYGRFRRRRY